MTNPQIKISLDEVNDSDVNAKPHKISKKSTIFRQKIAIKYI